MKDEEKSVTQPSQPMLKSERWMDFLVEGLERREHAARKRWKKQLSKLFNRCIVTKCQSLLVDKNGRLRATNVVGKAVCQSCRQNHKRWYKWFRGKDWRNYFTNGDYLLKTHVGFDGVLRLQKVCGKIYDASVKPARGLDTLRWSSRGEMLDGSPVPKGVRGPRKGDVDLLDRPVVSEPTPIITGWERGDVVHKSRSGKHKPKRIHPWRKKQARERAKLNNELFLRVEALKAQ